MNQARLAPPTPPAETSLNYPLATGKPQVRSATGKPQVRSATGKPQVRSAAVYARISADQGGQGLGVQRQLEDCRKLAADRGWTVGEEYVDNDISAYSGKPRPAYARMIADVTGGLRDAVLVYNLDRLHRRPVELEEFVTLCEKAGVREVATVTADIDLGNDDGLFMARIFAAFAAKESGRRSARIRRKMDQNATAGLPHGPARPFGYEADKITVREDGSGDHPSVGGPVPRRRITSLTGVVAQQHLRPHHQGRRALADPDPAADAVLCSPRGPARAPRPDYWGRGVGADHHRREAGAGAGPARVPRRLRQEGTTHTFVVGVVALRQVRQHLVLGQQANQCR